MWDTTVQGTSHTLWDWPLQLHKAGKHPGKQTPVTWSRGSNRKNYFLEKKLYQMVCSEILTDPNSHFHPLIYSPRFFVSFSIHHLKELTLSYQKIIKPLIQTQVMTIQRSFFSQKKQAMFHERIIDLHELRVASEYFMVGYYGRGFPLFLRVSDYTTSILSYP